MTRPRFWETVPLAAMTPAEWEAICDGCAKCCLVKLADAADGTVFYTDVHCRLLDPERCRCRDYAHRTAQVPSCVVLRPERLEAVYWMPTGCSYRRLAEGRGLAPWHHLRTGDAEAIHRAGASLRGRCVAEDDVAAGELEDRLVDWPVTETGDDPDARRGGRLRGPKRAERA